LELGVDVFGVSVTSKISYGIRGGLKNTYGESEISTFSTSFSDKDSLHVKLGWISSGPGGCGADNGNTKLLLTRTGPTTAPW